MLASEVINAYETYCPQEFSMEGDSRGLQIGTLDKDNPKKSWLPLIYVKIQWQKLLKRV